nr:c-type cytochrome [Parvularcula dongshanensis]
MTRSIELHADNDEVPPPAAPGLARLGAGHFAGGCEYCHGKPGVPPDPISRRMLPMPPKLERASDHWTQGELAWILDHGIQASGMPAWPSQVRADEVWAVVAFLEELPNLSTAEYERMVAGNARLGARSADEITDWGEAEASLTGCARCHDTPDAPPVSTLVPRLGGQSRDYLLAALKQYHLGDRESGFMMPVAAALDAAQRSRLADYYAALETPPHEQAPPDEGAVARGEQLALFGDKDGMIPSCRSCHGEGARADYPKLDGQSADYLAQQLRLWQDGVHGRSEAGRIMATIAQRMSAEQVKDSAAYYASRPAFAPGGGTRQARADGAP